MALDLTCLTTCQAKVRSASSASVGRAARGDVELARQQPRGVAILGQEAAFQPLDVVAGVDRVGQLVQRQQAQVGLGREHLARGRVSTPGAITTSVKMRAISRRGLAVERTVAGDDAAEGAERVAGQRLAVGLEHACRPRPRRRGWRA